MSKQIKLSIPGMKCGGCVSAIEKALDAEAGVINSKVDLSTKSALVESTLSEEVLSDTIKAAGFEVAEFLSDDGELS